ncbi:MAG: phosphatase PAP2 family protein [Daejeonella sp.]
MTMLQWLKEIDKELLLYINSHHNPFWDKIMWFASGHISWIPLYVILLILVIFKFKKQSWWLIALIIPLILASDQLASGILKPLVQRLRPSHEPGLENILHYVNNYRGGTYGFVSSHVCNVFALATYFSLTAAKRIKWLPYLLFPWAFLVSYSRIYLGVHYPGDVIVPMILGTILGFIIAFIYYRFSFNSHTLTTK